MTNDPYDAYSLDFRSRGYSLESTGQQMHEFAKAKGWWDRPVNDRIPRLFQWLEEELEEVKVAWVVKGAESWFSTDAQGLQKPEGLGSELADMYLIIADIAHGLGIDLAADAQLKAEYDYVRKFKRDGNGDPLP